QTGKFTRKQSYGGDTNVLATTFNSRDGRIRLTDFMPCFMVKGELKGLQELHRIVYCLEVDPGLRITFQPRFNYARGNTIIRETRDGCLARNQRHHVSLASSVKLLVSDKDLLVNDFRLSRGQRIVFVLKCGTSSPTPAAS